MLSGISRKGGAAVKLFVFCLAVAVSTAFGQCEFDVSASDATCSEANDCLSVIDCEVKVFTVPCSGCYCLKVRFECGEEKCKYCRVCANVYDGGSRISTSNCHNPDCLSGSQCSVDCCEGTHQNVFYLERDREYKLYVCKNECDNVGCDECPDECVAIAELHQANATLCE